MKWRKDEGFTLVEVLVALAILGLALLLGLGLLAQQRGVLSRLEAREEADRALASTLERLRSGAVELREGLAVVPGAGAAARSARDLTVVVRTRRREPPADLFETVVEARYRVGGQARVHRLETLFWKPGKLKVHR